MIGYGYGLGRNRWQVISFMMVKVTLDLMDLMSHEVTMCLTH